MPTANASIGNWLPWLTAAATVVLAVRNGFAAARDRRALKHEVLQRQKLELEISRLRNSPETVGDRRSIYDRLRKVVGEVLVRANPSHEQIYALHEIRHDAEFRFPQEVVAEIKTLIRDVIELYAANRRLEIRRSASPVGESDDVYASNMSALERVQAFEDRMVSLFRPFLQL